MFPLASVSRLALRPTQLLIQMDTGGRFPGVKRSGRDADHSPPYTAEVNEQLYLLSHLAPAWRVEGFFTALLSH
jgi:hypothetical protein